MSLDMATSKIDPSQMSDEEIELTLELFRRKRERGQKVEPVASPAVAEPVVKRRNSKDIDPKWFSVTKVCPHCEKEKNVGRDFGVIYARNGKQYPNAWCKQCRSEESANYKAGKRSKK